MKMLFLICFLFIFHIAAKADGLDDIVAQTQSSDPAIRMNAFASLKPYLSANLVDPRAVNATISLLALEIQEQDAADDDADYFADVIASTASLNNPAAIPVLVQVIDTGNLVPNALARFGPQALGHVLSRASDPDWLVRKCVMIALVAFLQPDNFSSINSPLYLQQISSALSAGAADSSPYVSSTALLGIKSFPSGTLKGDVNRDGTVNCADVTALRASFGKKLGQTGFNPLADLNGDGVVDIRDLAILSQQLPAGTRCQ